VLDHYRSHLGSRDELEPGTLRAPRISTTSPN
jgi:hypothetical protein